MTPPKREAVGLSLAGFQLADWLGRYINVWHCGEGVSAYAISAAERQLGTISY